MALLDVNGLQIFYGDLQAVFDMNFTVADGEAVALVGANGAGKSTFLKALVGLNEERRGAVHFDGIDISQMPAEEVSRLGLIMVPEGRLLFDSLTIEENLLMGSVNRREGSWTLRRVFDLFPILEERRRMFPGQLSGGQQQMAAIGRALMSNPRLLLCDELSLGLAPVVIRDIYGCLSAIAAQGTTVVLVEQDINRALDASARFYCFQEGRLALTAPTKDFDRRAITAAYFGL